MSNQKGLFQGLFDFSFQEPLSLRIIKLLYIIFLVAGGISLVAAVISGLQQSAAQGLLALVFGAVALFVWVLLVRVLLEALIAVFRIAHNTDLMAGGRSS